MGRGDDVGIVGETEVVVGAEVDHLVARGERDLPLLHRGDDALCLVEPVGFEPLEAAVDVVVETVGGAHGGLLLICF